MEVLYVVSRYKQTPHGVSPLTLEGCSVLAANKRPARADYPFGVQLNGRRPTVSKGLVPPYRMAASAAPSG